MREHIDGLQSELFHLKMVSRATEAQIWASWKAAKADLLKLQGPQVYKSLCFVHIALYTFTNKDERICLKLLNKQIAARAKGVWLPFFPPSLRRSRIVRVDPDSTTLFQFHDETAILQEWFKTGTISQLVGFETNLQDRESELFNFILSNGNRSTQREKGNTYTGFDNLIPADALKKIRSVTIHYHDGFICGFSFFGKVGALLWEIGNT
jgi:hypothetical protein